MKANLNLDPLYEAEVRRMASDAKATVSDIVTGIVKLYIDRRVLADNPSQRRGSAIQDQNGNRYASVKEACKKLGLHEALVYCVLRGTRPSTGGYTFSRV